jgi:hypothetical protein
MRGRLLHLGVLIVFVHLVTTCSIGGEWEDALTQVSSKNIAGFNEQVYMAWTHVSL